MLKSGVDLFTAKFEINNNIRCFSIIKFIILHAFNNLADFNKK